jgi:hypothetical protein
MVLECCFGMMFGVGSYQNNTLEPSQTVQVA